MSLQGKRALITGSSRGIGRGIALKLAAKGVKVAINYRRNADAATETLTHVRSCGSDGFLIQADVSCPEDVRRMFTYVKADFAEGARRLAHALSDAAVIDRHPGEGESRLAEPRKVGGDQSPPLLPLAALRGEAGGHLAYIF